MNIPVTLNGNKMIIEANPDESLMKVLRTQGCSSVKCGCSQGHCGSCAVLLDDNPVATCKIPIGIIRDGDIVTLDYFARTKEYSIIMQGFDLAGIKLCGYCNAGKVFSAYQILKMNRNLSRNEIASFVNNLSPCCTDINTLVNGIVIAREIYNKGYEEIIKRYKRGKK
jgi:carbon-monoxide dehydrogenase small subunit